VSVGEVGQLLTGLAALVAAIQGWRNGKKIDAVHESTNGRMDKLLAVTKAASFAAGQKDEKDKKGDG
jgi:hypothetical protein